MEIEELRQTIYDLHLRGVANVTIAEMLGVHRNTVSNHLNKIRQEARLKVKRADPLEIVGEHTNFYTTVAQTALFQYHGADSESAKVALLEVAMKAHERMTKLQLETGVLPKKVAKEENSYLVDGQDVRTASVEELQRLKEEKLAALAAMDADSEVPSDGEEWDDD